MKKKLLLFSILISILLFPSRVLAYTTVYTNNGYFTPSYDESIDIINGWTGLNYTSPNIGTDPWLLSFDQHWNAKNVKGNYINVVADYIVVVKTENQFTNYMNSVRNTLKSENLRCGFGDYRHGYNESYAKPEVSNFMAYYTFQIPVGNFGGKEHIIRITYNYKQYVPMVNESSVNMTCWFERNPSDGLAAQIHGNSEGFMLWQTKTNVFEYLITDDPNVTLTHNFNTIQNQNQTIINQNETVIIQNDTIIDQNNQLIEEEKEQTETNKNIFQQILDLPGIIIDFLVDALIGLFVPDSEYFTDFFNRLKESFESQLGFLAFPFILVIDFLNRFLSLNSNSDFIINISEFTIPGFDVPIWNSISYNLRDILEHEYMKDLWHLYLDFVDVFLILNFLNFCYNKYQHIIGGQQSVYDFYTVEHSYAIDSKTGEAKNHMIRERKTTRKVSDES